MNVRQSADASVHLPHTRAGQAKRPTCSLGRFLRRKPAAAPRRVPQLRKLPCASTNCSRAASAELPRTCAWAWRWVALMPCASSSSAAASKRARNVTRRVSTRGTCAHSWSGVEALPAAAGLAPGMTMLVSPWIPAVHAFDCVMHAKQARSGSKRCVNR